MPLIEIAEQPPARPPAFRPHRTRIAVVFEPGRHGAAALAHAGDLAALFGSELTVVVEVPQATPSRRCSSSPTALNCAVLEAARAELRHASALLTDSGVDQRFMLLIESSDPPLPTFVAEGGFHTVVLPARWRILRAARHPAARRLRRVRGCSVRVVTHAGAGA